VFFLRILIQDERITLGTITSIEKDQTSLFEIIYEKFQNSTFKNQKIKNRLKYLNRKINS